MRKDEKRTKLLKKENIKELIGSCLGEVLIKAHEIRHLFTKKKRKLYVFNMKEEQEEIEFIACEERRE